MALESVIRKRCKEMNYSYEEFSENIVPLRKSFAIQQHEEAQNIVQQIKEHEEKFAFVGRHHFVGRQYSFGTYPTPEKRKDQKHGKNPRELEWFTNLFSIAAWARTHMAETSGIIQHIGEKTLAKVNELLRLPEKEYIWYSEQEILKALRNNLGNTNNRKKQFGIYQKNEVVEGQRMEDILQQLMPTYEHKFPLKGIPASKGKTQGTVKILLQPEDTSKMEENDILVAPETAPDFLPALKKAAGVITATGGITSHAAIVSRELGIPCVIGVKGATELLKDGDEVILDAEKGIIELKK